MLLQAGKSTLLPSQRSRNATSLPRAWVLFFSFKECYEARDPYGSSCTARSADSSKQRLRPARLFTLTPTCGCNAPPSTHSTAASKAPHTSPPVTRANSLAVTLTAPESQEKSGFMSVQGAVADRCHFYTQGLLIWHMF